MHALQVALERYVTSPCSTRRKKLCIEDDTLAVMGDKAFIEVGEVEDSIGGVQEKD